MTVDPDAEYCEGQTSNFTVEVRVPEDVKDPVTGQVQYRPIDEIVYFDWFFGTEDVYTQEYGNYGVSVNDALVAFRDLYPDATAVDESTPAVQNFSPDMYELLKYLSEDAPGESGGEHAHPLVLHQQSLNITFLASGLNVVAYPIKIDLEEQDAFVCWEYVPLTLSVSSSAPKLKPGFTTVKYPDDNADLDPCLRIGLKQIESVSTESEHSLIVNLRGAKYSGVGGDPTSMGLIADLDKMYLVSTDDPSYKEYFADGDSFDEYSLPVGNISSLEAHPSVSGESETNEMAVRFDLTGETDVTMSDGSKKKFKFEPKEGYTYNLAVHFEEKTDDDGTTTACKGRFVLPVKVVPEYVKWNGDGSSNWNNDTNWKRVSSKELKRTDYTADGFMTDGVNGNDNGFVPMLFTKVLMPANSQAYIYKAGYTNDSGGSSWGSERPAEITQDPTLNIQYDLMAYGNEDQYGKTVTEGNVTTQRYRVNMCDQIHFEPGAEMRRAEYLYYNRVWTDVEVPSGEWTVTGTPLQDIVAGDWYTQSTGRQATEYFKDITFTSGYNRLKPYVLQRSWGNSATIVENASVTTNVPVSFEALWSAVYNDTYTPYGYGTGFSIKTAAVDGGGKALFRFPKNDETYDYGNGTLTRENNGILASSRLVQRNTDMSAATEDESFTVNLSEVTEGKYAIVGNPFMSHLDIKKFLTVNSSVLKQKYWLIGSDGYPTSGTADSDGNWVDASSTADGALAAPFEAFYVELADGVSSREITFNVDMETLKPKATDEETTTSALTISASSKAGDNSAAALAYSAVAADGYEDAEDAQLMMNLSGNGDRLSVYTVAGGTAVSVNRIKDQRQIPLGLFAGDDDVTTLTFTGVSALLEPTLYDAEANTETPLTEGYQLNVDGQSHGRYFIRTRGAGEGTTGIDDAVASDGSGVSVYSVSSRQVVVSSDAALLDVAVYSAGGSLLRHESLGAGRTACTLNGVDSGVAIVRVMTEDGVTTHKITVR